MAGTLQPGEEILVTALPLYHIFALMVNFITCFSIGTENWLIANPSDLDGFIDIFIQARLSLFMGVNTLYAHLVTHPRIGEIDFSRLHLAGGGGAPVLDVTSRKWETLTGTFIREGYGLSETAPILSFNPASIREFTATTGLPVPGTDIKLLNEEGIEVAIGEAGEICAKGPQVMRGYWNKPDANTLAFTADGFFLSGYIGRFDELGFLSIVDPQGILFSATILGDAADHNGFGRMLMTIYNQKGIFGNSADTEAGFETHLKQHFRNVTFKREGCTYVHCDTAKALTTLNFVRFESKNMSAFSVNNKNSSSFNIELPNDIACRHLTIANWTVRPQGRLILGGQIPMIVKRSAAKEQTTW